MFKPCLNQKLNINQSLSIIYYASKTLKNGNHPLMLRIIQNGQTKYVSLGVNINPNFWDFKKCIILKKVYSKVTLDINLKCKNHRGGKMKNLLDFHFMTGLVTSLRMRGWARVTGWRAWRRTFPPRWREMFIPVVVQHPALTLMTRTGTWRMIAVEHWISVIMS